MISLGPISNSETAQPAPAPFPRVQLPVVCLPHPAPNTELPPAWHGPFPHPTGWLWLPLPYIQQYPQGPGAISTAPPGYAITAQLHQQCCSTLGQRSPARSALPLHSMTSQGSPVSTGPPFYAVTAKAPPPMMSQRPTARAPDHVSQPNPGPGAPPRARASFCPRRRPVAERRGGASASLAPIGRREAEVAWGGARPRRLGLWQRV